jgi:hypothetical protein
MRLHLSRLLASCQPQHPPRLQLLFGALLAVASFAAQAHARPGAGWFYYQTGDVTTQVDGIDASERPIYPVGFDMLDVSGDAYFQAGIDIGGEFIWGALTIMTPSLFPEPDDYGEDQSLLNVKAGAFHGGEKFAVGYGGDLDWRVNKYSEVNGVKADQRKIRVGLGPNVGVRLSPLSFFTFFPNISGYYYPWPNEDQSFIPKSFSSFGYRLEAPLMVDLIELFASDSEKFLVLSVMPYYSSKSGFYKKNDQTGEVKEASAQVMGLKMGMYWKLDIFTFMWKEH